MPPPSDDDVPQELARLPSSLSGRSPNQFSWQGGPRVLQGASSEDDDDDDDDEEFFSVDGDGGGGGVLEEALDDVVQWALDPFEDVPGTVPPAGGADAAAAGGADAAAGDGGEVLGSIAGHDRTIPPLPPLGAAERGDAGTVDPWASLIPPPPTAAAPFSWRPVPPGHLPAVDFHEVAGRMQSEAEEDNSALPQLLLLSVGEFRDGKATSEPSFRKRYEPFFISCGLRSARNASQAVDSSAVWGTRPSELHVGAVESPALPDFSQASEVLMDNPDSEPAIFGASDHAFTSSQHVEITCPNLPVLVSATGWEPLLEV
jgi:hypothetical protein